MKEKTIIITGATSGIGLAVSKELAALGHHLILACRNTEKAASVREIIIADTKNEHIEIEEVDLASLMSIRNFAALLKTKINHIDVLINNAGVFIDRKVKTKDGYDLSMSTNFIGQVLITNLLLPLLENASDSRIVNVSSEAALYGRLKITDDVFTRQRKGFPAYSASKFAQLIFTIDMSLILSKKGITVNAVHPGHIATNIWRGDSLIMKVMGPINRKMAMPAEEGAKICVYAALSDKLKDTTGKFIKTAGEIKYPKRILDKELQKSLMSAVYKELHIERPTE